MQQEELAKAYRAGGETGGMLAGWKRSRQRPPAAGNTQVLGQTRISGNAGCLSGTPAQRYRWEAALSGIRQQSPWAG